MPGRPEPLLCELHAHSTWSDGSLSIPQLVDLYGGAGFDVLAVTDHVTRHEKAWHPGVGLTSRSHESYLQQVLQEAERARSSHGLLVVPGLELTFDDPDPRQSAHALAIGLHEFVGLEEGLDLALLRARAHGAALVGAHPYTIDAALNASRTTARFAEEPDWAASTRDRFELCNRHDFFGWVASARLPVVATGDFHRLEHLATWKTLLPAVKSEAAVVDYLRSRRPVSLTRIEPPAARSTRAA